MSIVSAIIFVVSLATIPWLISRIPEDYFIYEKRNPAIWQDRHPIFRLCLLIGKNILGLILLCGGVIMLFTPGQGLFTMVLGLILMDYPGKYRFEKYLATQPKIFNGLNWLRARNNNPPLRKD